jgi:hypothetical protein
MLLMEKAGRNSKERVNLVEGHKFQVVHSALEAKRFETWPPLTHSARIQPLSRDQKAGAGAGERLTKLNVLMSIMTDPGRANKISTSICDECSPRMISDS